MADECNVAEEMKHCYENLIVIDSGANLTNKKYSRDLDSVIQRAQDAGKLNSFSFEIIHSIRSIHSIYVASFHSLPIFLCCKRSRCLQAFRVIYVECVWKRGENKVHFFLLLLLLLLLFIFLAFFNFVSLF